MITAKLIRLISGALLLLFFMIYLYTIYWNGLYFQLYLAGQFLFNWSPAISLYNYTLYGSMTVPMNLIQQIGVVGLIPSSSIFTVATLYNYEFNIRNTITFTLLTAINLSIIYIAFWTVVWFILEYQAPIDFIAHYVTPFGDKYYAWGSNNLFPIVYWHRSNIWAVSLILLIITTLNTLIVSNYEEWFPKSTATIGVAFILIDILFSNLAIDIFYGVIIILTSLFILFLIYFENFYHGKTLTAILLIFFLLILLCNINATLCKPQTVTSTTAYNQGGYYFAGSSEYIPDYFLASYTILFSVQGDGELHNVTLTVSNINNGGFPSITIPLQIRADGTFYSSTAVNAFCMAMHGQSVNIGLIVDSPNCFIQIYSDIKLNIGGIWLGGLPTQTIGVHYI